MQLNFHIKQLFKRENIKFIPLLITFGLIIVLPLLVISAQKVQQLFSKAAAPTSPIPIFTTTSTGVPQPVIKKVMVLNFNPTILISTLPETGSFSSLSADLGQSKAQFNFSWSGSQATFTINISTDINMAKDVYVKFAQGSTSPLILDNPQNKWNKYVCGAVLHWRVIASTGDQSQIQHTFVCDSTPPQSNSPHSV